MTRVSEALLPVPASSETLPARNPRQDQNGGWVLLLPGLRSGEVVLCLELGLVEYCGPLLYWHGDVNVLALGSGPARHAVYRDGQRIVVAAVDWKPGQQLPFASSEFSGVVVRLAGALAPAHSAALQLNAAFWRQIRRVLAPTGFLYLEVDGNLSLHNLEHIVRGRWSQVAVGPRRRYWRNQLKIAGFGAPAEYSLLNERGGLAEILPEPDQAIAAEPVGFRERVKLRLLGRWGRRHFASACGLLAAGSRRSTLLDELLLVCDDPGGMNGVTAGGSLYRTARIAVTPGKVFVQFVHDLSTAGSLFVVVPMNQETLDRRRRELAAMHALRATQLDITRLLPSVAREAQCRGRAVFIYSAIRGHAIDRPVAQFRELLQRAFDLLVAFNRASRRDIIIGQAEFESVVGAALDGALARYSALEEPLVRLGSELDKHLKGRHLPVAWLHGDFKIENLLFDMRDLKVTGVIDWELASPVGLMMVDLLYLLAYGRVTAGAVADVLEVVETAILNGGWTEQEQSLIDGYARNIQLPAHYMVLASAVFFVHHVGMRFTYAESDPDCMARLGRILEQLASRLETVRAAGLHA